MNSTDLAASPLLSALRGTPGSRTPVWFMRQAGRSLPEYKAVREGIPMLKACLMPELVAEITLQPVRRYGVDAAIFYSDIVVPLLACGVDVEIRPGVGPVIENPVRTRADLERVLPLESGALPEIAQAIGLLTAALGDTPLIGFAGAPFTLASYLIEGGPSRDLLKTKSMMYGDPQLFTDVLARLAQICGEFLCLQIGAGASAVQLFDSWVGSLSLADYERYVRPASMATLARVHEFSPQTPRIHFGVGTGELLVSMSQAGCEAIGVDFRIPLSEAIARVGSDKVVQGNLDPALLFAPWDVIKARVLDILEQGRGAAGHVFNLGHGVPPEANPDVLARIVELVHSVERP